MDSVILPSTETKLPLILHYRSLDGPTHWQTLQIQQILVIDHLITVNQSPIS